MEQLHASALSIVPSTSNATLPQWQLPLYRIGPPKSIQPDAPFIAGQEVVSRTAASEQDDVHLRRRTRVLGLLMP
jgi:hypothetical protein